WGAAYFLTSNGTIYRVTGVDKAQPTWTIITGPQESDVPDLPGSKLAGKLDALEVIKTPAQGSEPAHTVLLVGGRGGVYRAIDPTDQGTQHWTEFGKGLPNTRVSDLHYIPDKDLLLAGTLGRGAWILQNASQFLTKHAILNVTAEAGPATI